MDEFDLVFRPGSRLGSPVGVSGLTLADVSRETLAAHRHLVMEGLPGINALPESYALVAARSATLAAVGTFDFPWLVFGPLGWVFDSPLNSLFGAISGSPLGDAARAIGGVLADLGNLIWSSIVNLGQWIISGLSSAANLLAGLLNPILRTTIGWVSDAIGGVSATLWGVFGYVAGALDGTLRTVIGWVQTAIGGVSSMIWAAITALGNGLVNTLWTVTGWVRDALGGVSSTIGSWLQYVGNVVAQAIGWVGTQIGDVFTGAIQFLWTGAATLTMIAIQGAIALAGFLKQYVVDPIVAAGQVAVKFVLDGLGGAGTGDPEAAIGLAGALLIGAIPLGLGAHTLAVAAEHSHPIKQVGYGLIARELVDMTNIKKISDATIGAGYGVALGRPMEYWLSRRVRWQIPAPRDLMLSYTKRDIGAGELALAMAYHGFSEQRIAYMTESAWREPRPFELRRLMDSGVVPEPWLRSKLRRNQLRDEDVDVIATALLHNQYATQRSALYNAAWRLLKDGASTPERFAGDVAGLGLPDDQVAFGIKAAALDHAADMVNFQITTLLAQAKNGQISVDEFGVALSALGVVPDRVELEKARARTAIIGKVAASATAAAAAEYRRVQQEQSQLWIQQYRRGLIDDQTLLGNLVALGIDPDLATITVQIEVARRTPLVPVKADTSAADNLAAVTKALRKAYVDEFRVGLVTADELSADLVAIGLDPALVDAIVVDEVAKGYSPPQSTPSPAEEAAARALLNAQVAYLREQFRAGYIIADEYLAGLTDAGMDPDLAAVTVEREQLRLDVINEKAAAKAAAAVGS